MDVGPYADRSEVQVAPAPHVILLDTNAVIWLQERHRRTRSLESAARLYLSPASLLELQILIEAGRLRQRQNRPLSELGQNASLSLDEPPAGRWFSVAADVGWTRDPFDRLLVAHARVRGWKLATADRLLLEHLGSSEALVL